MPTLYHPLTRDRAAAHPPRPAHPPRLTCTPYASLARRLALIARAWVWRHGVGGGRARGKEMRNTTWSVFSRPPMNSSLTTSDPAARDARTRHTSHTPRLHALPSIPSQCCLVVLTQPPDPPHHLLQAGARPEDRSRCARLQLASRYALQLPQHTPHTAPHTPHTHGRAHGCEEMCSRRSTYFWPSHIC